MECKASSTRDIDMPDYIGIYPEWNVKYDKTVNLPAVATIGIYPEWNVKSSEAWAKGYFELLEYIQNGM